MLGKDLIEFDPPKNHSYNLKFTHQRIEHFYGAGEYTYRALQSVCSLAIGAVGGKRPKDFWGGFVVQGNTGLGDPYYSLGGFLIFAWRIPSEPLWIPSFPRRDA